MRFSLIPKSALNMMRHDRYLNVVDFVHRPVGKTFKAEIFQTSLVEETRKIYLQIFLVAVDVADHVKVKIYKPKPP